MHYNRIRKMDISNGPGVRVSIFFQGCPFHCKGCFNEKAQDFDGGRPYTTGTEIYILDLLNNFYIKRLTILGGEPLIERNIEQLERLLYITKEEHPNITIWLYTGRVYEEISNEYGAILNNVDVLVDGPFIESLRDVTLPFRGSSNQRLINMVKTREKGEVVLYE